MVGIAVLLMVIAFFYRHTQRDRMAEINQQMAKEIAVLQETVSMKKIWDDKKAVQKLDRIKTLVPDSKLKWQKRGKKLIAKFSDMLPSEVNKVVTKMLNIAVQIESLKIEKSGERYTMEITCKW
jgi:hypothetical protein